jgi:hypothetical protein
LLLFQRLGRLLELVIIHGQLFRMGGQLVGVHGAKDGSEPQDLGVDKGLTRLHGVIPERRGQVSAQCLLVQLAAERNVTSDDHDK